MTHASNLDVRPAPTSFFYTWLISICQVTERFISKHTTCESIPNSSITLRHPSRTVVALNQHHYAHNLVVIILNSNNQNFAEEKMSFSLLLYRNQKKQPTKVNDEKPTNSDTTGMVTNAVKCHPHLGGPSTLRFFGFRSFTAG